MVNIKPIAKIRGTQDGAIWNGFLFRFDPLGSCAVYDLNTMKESKEEACKPIAEFRLDESKPIRPHNNSVSFGNQYFAPEDEFPLLYTNIYNNYARNNNPMKGVCLVYRITRKGYEFSSELVQIIEIGFVEDCSYWKSNPPTEDVRPYGNFTIDADTGKLYAFTMRDGAQATRFFDFNIPELSEGEKDSVYGVNRVVLTVDDIKEYFDCEYQHYIQGVCCHKGKIYSAEGFSDSIENPPAIRVIDLEQKRQVLYIDLPKLGYIIEPEMIGFENNICYYSDYDGNLYEIDFEV